MNLFSPLRKLTFAVAAFLAGAMTATAVCRTHPPTEFPQSIIIGALIATLLFAAMYFHRTALNYFVQWRITHLKSFLPDELVTQSSASLMRLQHLTHIPTRIKTFFLFVILFCLGSAYTTTSFLTLNTSSCVQSFTAHPRMVSMTGSITRESIVLSNSVLVTFSPREIRVTADRGTQQWHHVRTDIALVVPFDRIKTVPAYGEWYTVQGTLRRVSQSEHAYLMQMGCEARTLLTLDDIAAFQRTTQKGTLWYDALGNATRAVQFMQMRTIKAMRRTMSEQGVALVSWLFFGIKDGIPAFLRSEANSSNGLMVLVRSKFYIWFLVVLLIFARNIKPLRKIFYVLTIPFVLAFLALNYCSPNVARPSVIIIFFLLFASHHRATTVLFPVLCWSLLGCIVFDPFVFTDKWFIYFIALCLASVYGRVVIDAVLQRIARGWILWIGWCVCCMLCVLAVFPTFCEYPPLCALIVWGSLVGIASAALLQRVVPWKQLSYSSLPQLLRFLIALWIALHVFALIPLSLFYVDPFNTASVFINLPIYILVALLMQMGFVGNVTGTVVYINQQVSISLLDSIRWYNATINELVVLLKQCMRLEFSYLPGKCVFIMQNNACTLLGLILLFVVLYVVVKYASRIQRYVRIAHYIVRTQLKRWRQWKKWKTVQRRHAVRRVGIIVGIICCVVCAGLWCGVHHVPRARIQVFSNDLATFMLCTGPRNTRVLVVDIAMPNTSLITKIKRRWGLLDFFLKRGITHCDAVVLLHPTRNLNTVALLGDLLRYIPARMVYICNEQGMHPDQYATLINASPMDTPNSARETVAGKCIADLKRAAHALSRTTPYHVLIANRTIVKEKNYTVSVVHNGLVSMLAVAYRDVTVSALCTQTAPHAQRRIRQDNDTAEGNKNIFLTQHANGTSCALVIDNRHAGTSTVSSRRALPQPYRDELLLCTDGAAVAAQ